jgi:hypothetical protein
VRLLGGAPGALTLLLLLRPPAADAIQLDDRGEIRLGLRTYSAVRVGTEREGGPKNPLSFPISPAGHVRQNRFFLSIKLDHDIKRLATSGTGLARAFGWLKPSALRYSLQYRGEWEGLYDYGPDEFSHPWHIAKQRRLDVPNSPAFGLTPVINDRFINWRTAHLRNNARSKQRLFTAYLDVERGPVFLRIGRQILAWGETDVFRLLDNINPLDNGFGGFLIPLDERRIPLDMIRANYHFGSIGPLADAFLEGFAAQGNVTATSPGIPPGSPWEPGGLGSPNPILRVVAEKPDFADIRGGFRFVFTTHDVTATLAHYWTYLDIPGVDFRIPPGLVSQTNQIYTVQRVPRTPITGASVTFPVPRWYSIVRSELAYIYNQPTNRQGKGASANAAFAQGTPQFNRLRAHNNTVGGLDPFVYPGFLWAQRPYQIRADTLKLDTLNFVLGLDVNRYIRWLNKQQTFFFTTQFFYNHFFDSPGDLVLPVPAYNQAVAKSLPLIGLQTNPDGSPIPGVSCRTKSGQARACNLRPRLIHVKDDNFLQTLLITTTYRGGRVIPALGMFYDWQGTWLFQPGVTYIRDPFRFVFDYTAVIGAIGSGQIAALRDRDNVRFQVEFVF